MSAIKVAAASALLASAAAATTICDVVAERPTIDKATDTVTVVTHSVSGPVCYKNGVVIDLAEGSGNVRVADAWFAGEGIRLLSIPAGVALTLDDVKVRPTVHVVHTRGNVMVSESRIMAGIFSSMYPKPTAFAGTVTLNDVQVDVDVSASMSGYMERQTSRALSLMYEESTLHLEINGGSFKVRGQVEMPRIVSLIALRLHGGTGGTLAMKPSAKTGKRIVVAVEVLAGGKDTIYPSGCEVVGARLPLAHMSVTVSCAADRSCKAAGVRSLPGVELSDSDVSVTTAPRSTQAFAIDAVGGAVRIFRSTMKAVAPRNVMALRANDATDIFVSESALSVDLLEDRASAFAVQLSGAWKRLRVQRSVITAVSANYVSYGIEALGGSNSSIVELVDSSFPFRNGGISLCPVINNGYSGPEMRPIPSFDLQVAARNVRCSFRQDEQSQLVDDSILSRVAGKEIANIRPMVIASTLACPHGYVVPESGTDAVSGGSTVVSLVPGLPPFSTTTAPLLCVAPPAADAAPVLLGTGSLVLRGLAAGATAAVDAPALKSVTVEGGVPAGAVLVVNGTSLGAGAGEPAAPAALVVAGSVAGELRVTGGITVRGAVSVSGEVGPAGRIVVDGATLVFAQAAAVTVGGALRGVVALGAADATIIRRVAALKAGPGGAALVTVTLPGTPGGACPVSLGPMLMTENVDVALAGGGAAAESCASLKFPAADSGSGQSPPNGSDEDKTDGVSPQATESGGEGHPPRDGSDQNNTEGVSPQGSEFSDKKVDTVLVASAASGAAAVVSTLAMLGGGAVWLVASS